MSDNAPGDTVAGAALRYSNALGDGASDSADVATGTWRLMGNLSSAGDAQSTSLFLRIA